MTVKELLGHKTIEMTLRYAHLSPQHKQKAVESLGLKMDTFWTPEPENRFMEKAGVGESVDISNVFRNAPVAQLDRAVDFESIGRAFESPRACQISL